MPLSGPETRDSIPQRNWAMPDTTVEASSSKLLREASVLGSGAANGFSNGLSDAAHHPLRVAGELMGAGAIALAARGPVWLRGTATVAGVIGTTAFAADIRNRVEEIAPAASALWQSDKASSSAYKKAGEVLGPLAFDTTSMLLIGGMGAKFGQKLASDAAFSEKLAVAQAPSGNKILALHRENLTIGTNAAKAGFGYAPEILNPAPDFKAAVNPNAYERLYGGNTHAPTDMQYFLAASKDRQVLGTTGLYKNPQDHDKAAWLGWFSVKPEFRGRGVGRELLQFSVDQAKAQDNRYLRLYTSDHPGEAAAQHLYEKMGFKVTSVEPPNEHGVRIVYRQRDLAETPKETPNAWTGTDKSQFKFQSTAPEDPSWHRIYESEFPQDERQPYSFLESLSKPGAVPHVKVQTTLRNGETAAFSLTSDYGEGKEGRQLLLPYIAVAPELQSTGIGTKHLDRMINELKGTYPTAKGIVLEAEDPLAAGIDAAAKAAREKRIDWYQKRNGVVLDRPYFFPSSIEGEPPIAGKLIWLDFGRGGMSKNGYDDLVTKIYKHGYELEDDHPLMAALKH